MAPRGRPKRTTRSRPVTATPPPVTDPTTTTLVTSAQLQAMIDEGVTAVLAARATTRNGDDSHTSGTGARRNERTIGSAPIKLHERSTHIHQGTEEWFDLTRGLRDETRSQKTMPEAIEMATELMVNEN
ncbi:hypothetical protein Tco_0276216 [Tanacetum coccineum]